jgi:hypothetical protein
MHLRPKRWGSSKTNTVTDRVLSGALLLLKQQTCAEHMHSCNMSLPQPLPSTAVQLSLPFCHSTK